MNLQTDHVGVLIIRRPSFCDCDLSGRGYSKVDIHDANYAKNPVSKPDSHDRPQIRFVWAEWRSVVEESDECDD